MSYDFDLTYQVSPQALPTCPLCGSPIFHTEQHGVILCRDVVALAHTYCAIEDDFDEEDDDE